jgi:hypothetical protein
MAESMKLKNDVGEFPGVITLFRDPAMLYTTLIPFTADHGTRLPASFLADEIEG